MNDWGSIPDWINVIIAFLAFIGFLAVERERLPLKKNLPSNMLMEKKQEQTVNNFQNQPTSTEEDNIVFRAGLYSRILMGVVLGLALNPIYSLAFSGLIANTKISDYDVIASAQSTASIASAVILSTLLSVAYLKFSPNLVSVFVHWAERLFFSYILFSAIQVFAYVDWNHLGEYYVVEKIEFEPFLNVIFCIFLLLLTGFPSTPVEWIIALKPNQKRKGNKK